MTCQEQNLVVFGEVAQNLKGLPSPVLIEVDQHIVQHQRQWFRTPGILFEIG